MTINGTKAGLIQFNKIGHADTASGSVAVAVAVVAFVYLVIALYLVRLMLTVLLARKDQIVLLFLLDCILLGRRNDMGWQKHHVSSGTT